MSAATRTTDEPVIDARGISVEYRRRTGFRRHENIVAVREVDVRVYRGTTIGIVGESGSGKSSLGRVLLGLQRPTRGSVSAFGVDISSGRMPVSLRLRIQSIFQDPRSSLNPRRSIFESISRGPQMHGLWLPEEARARSRAALERVGLGAGELDKFPFQLSGGQLQRVSIARALALEPEVLVCDEPVASLDVSIQAGVIALLAELQREKGIAYVFIAHDLAVVEQISDEVCVMYLGSVVERGSVGTVFHSPEHPYTRALLACHPVPEPPPAGSGPQLLALEGEIPSPASPPSGCAFHTRCPLYTALGEPDACTTRNPVLPTEGGSACHFSESNTDDPLHHTSDRTHQGDDCDA